MRREAVPTNYRVLRRDGLRWLFYWIGLWWCGFAVSTVVPEGLDEVSTTLQITTTIIVAYASFYFSEIACGCSGVLATVMAALCVARYGWVYVDEAHTVPGGVQVFA